MFALVSNFVLKFCHITVPELGYRGNNLHAGEMFQVILKDYKWNKIDKQNRKEF